MAESSESLQDTFSVNSAQITKAVHAIYQYVEKTQEKSLSSQLEPTSISLQLGLRKIPSDRKRTLKVCLPHTLVTETTDICLFVKDLDKKDRDYAPTVNHFRELLRNKGVNNITEIVPLKSLKLEYTGYEAKRNLSSMYDVYLADERIVRLLTPCLGKNFYRRRRFPQQVNLDAKDLKKEIDNVLRTATCQIDCRGSTCRITIGHVGLTEAQTVGNVQEAVRELAKEIPGGSVNIKSLYLKTNDSPSLPLYVSLGGEEEVILPLKVKKEEMGEPEEVSTIENAKVLVTPRGDIRIIPNKNFEETNVEDLADDKKPIVIPPEAEDDEVAPPVKKSRKTASKELSVAPKKHTRSGSKDKKLKNKGKMTSSKGTAQEKHSTKSVKKIPFEKSIKVSRKRKLGK